MISANKIKDVKGYDEFIRDRGANFFYQRFWMELLEENEKKAVYFYKNTGGVVSSFVSLFLDRNIYESMPWSVPEKVYVGGDIKYYINEFKKLKCGIVLLNNISEEQAWEFEKDGFIVYPSFVYPQLKVSSIKDFWSSLKSFRRKELRKAISIAEKESLEVIDVSSGEDIKSYFMLEKENMERVKSSARPLKYWKTVFGKVPKEDILFLLVKREGKVIAGRISFINKDKIFNFRGVSLKDFQYCHANELLHLRVIEEAIKRNIFLIDYGASDIGNFGSYVFKRKFANREKFLWAAVYVVDEKLRDKYLKIAKDKKELLNKFLSGK